MANPTEDTVLQTEKKPGPREPITWRALEYTHTEKGSDWYWALGLIAVAGSVASVLFNNVLFAVLILISAFALALFASREPEEYEFAVTQRGVRIGDQMHPYQTLKSFGIEDRSPNHIPKLHLEAKSPIVPNITIPIVGVDPDKVHDLLLDFLPEDDHMEPLMHRMMEWLGF